MIDFASRLSHILLVLTLCLILWVLGYAYLCHERATLERLDLVNHTNAQKIAWQAVNNTHRLGMQTYFEMYVMQPQVLDLLRIARKGGDTEQAVARVKLYRLFYPVYRQLQQRDVRQIHFHTPDSRSFLRMHTPHLYGDSLLESRPSVRMANRDRKIVQGFEAGRTIAGFRNVFPIVDRGEHLGSMEFSQPFEALREAMHLLDPDKEFVLLFNGPLLLPKLFDEFRKLYAPSLIHPDWLEEDPQHELPDSPPPLSEKTQAIYARLASSTEVQSALGRGEAASFVLRGEESPAKITLLPLIDLEGKPAAVLLSFSPAPAIAEIDRNYFFYLGIFTLILLFGGIFLYLFLRSKQTVEAEQRFLNLITDTMDDGLYVIDSNGMITYVNARATRLLGFSGDEMIGADAHALFHLHGIQGTRHLMDCPIYQNLHKGEIFHGEELFVRKDGTTFMAEISSQPIVWKGEWSASVTVFRDIHARKEAEIALQAEHDKLELLSNTIDTQIWYMTDPQTYGAVNRAHAEFCGHTREEMEQKNIYELLPKEMADKCVSTTIAVFRDKQPVRGEQRAVNTRGERRLLSVLKTPKLNRDGTVEYVVCSAEDVTERKRMEEELLHLSNTDPLTAAFNRRYFLQALEAEMHRSQRYGSSFSLLMLDLDHFKAINDTYGHETGDLVLKNIIAFVKGRIRTTDVLARWGGEEFVLLLVNTPLASAIPFVEDLRERIRSLQIAQAGAVTASIGLTAYRENESRDALLNRADALVYEAKAAGRDCMKTSP